MSILVGQLPPAEVARLKAELAETLIAHFCYPRFYDYRTGTLRSRPVDRSKRQEVWLYLSSFDFTAWNRTDIMSADFQQQVERLFIHFVQRNRTFFGEQGRKRMSDIRLLLGASAQSVVQGLRNHLSGQRQGNPPFGSPRPAASWSGPNANGSVDLDWEQMAQATMTLQQQLQEMRGEVKAAPPTPQMETPAVASRRSGRRSSAPARPQSASETQREPVKSPANGHSVHASADHKNTSVASRPTSWSNAPTAPVPAVEVALASAAPVAAPVKPVEAPAARVATPERMPAPPPTPAPVIPHPAAKAATPAMTTGQRSNSAQLANEEDVAIFEEMRRQLIIWLRIQAIQAGIELTGQGPAQLLELLRQHDNYDETRLQVVSTLLNLANQVVTSGHATHFDYKQGLMFHLMHTQK